MPLVLFATAAPSNPPLHAGSSPQTNRLIAQTGSVHDFDYFMGSGWITQQHRLDARGSWENFTGYQCSVPYLNGMATVDELYFPSKGSSGLTLRTFDLKKRQWSIYWVSSRDGTLDSDPEVGGFDGNLGVFYGKDVDEKGRPMEVRFQWKIIDHDHATWKQALSYDNRIWKTNWTADFVRADRTEICKDNRPRREITSVDHGMSH